MSDRMTGAVDGLRLVRGTAGYGETADALAVQYEEVSSPVVMASASCSLSSL